MSRFTKHFRMNELDAIEYIREKLPDYFGDAELESKEISDGNINYVFRVKEKNGSKTIIVKHADAFIRTSGNPKSTDRNRIEVAALEMERKVAPYQVPEVYLYDPVMCCIVMQDVGDHKNLRYALIDHEMFSTLAEDLAEFLANTLIRTTDLIMPTAERNKLAGHSVNTEMCEITERLVYDEPYTNARGSNVVFEPNAEFVQRNIYENTALHVEAAKLKTLFQTKSQSLIHGDLHSGSVFVKEGSTMVLDPEFSFYGPAGYDVGNVIAHFLFAWANAEVTMEEGAQKEQFKDWVEQCICHVTDAFYSKAVNILKAECKDSLYSAEGFAEWYVNDILCDTAGSVGLELIRRVVGDAKVKDIAGIGNEEKRTRAERICLRTAEKCIMHKGLFLTGSAYVAEIRKAACEN